MVKILNRICYPPKMLSSTSEYVYWQTSTLVRVSFGPKKFLYEQQPYYSHAGRSGVINGDQPECWKLLFISEMVMQKRWIKHCFCQGKTRMNQIKHIRRGRQKGRYSYARLYLWPVIRQNWCSRVTDLVSMGLFNLFEAFVSLLCAFYDLGLSVKAFRAV